MQEVIKQEKLEFISSYTSKLLKAKFGKGPESSYSSYNHHLLIIYLRKIVSPMEEVLLEQQKQDIVQNLRSIIIESILPNIQEVISKHVKKEVQHIYHDWNFYHNSGVIIATFHAEGNKKSVEGQIFLEQKELKEEVIRLCEQIHKTPDYVRAYRVSPNTYIVEYESSLLPIEKIILEKGYSEILKATHGDFRHYFFSHGNFKMIFQRSLRDIFIGWSEKTDKRIICFFLDK